VKSSREYSQVAHDALLVSINKGAFGGSNQASDINSFSTVRYFLSLAMVSILNEKDVDRILPNTAVLSGLVVRELRLSQGLDFSYGLFDSVFSASWVSRTYTPQEALDYVLDSTYMGAESFGLGQAASHYYSKKAQWLNKSEVVSLIVISLGPSRYRECDDRLLLQKKAEGLVGRLKKLKPVEYAGFQYKLPDFSYC